MRGRVENDLAARRLDEDRQAGVDAAGLQGGNEGVEVHRDSLHLLDADPGGHGAGDFVLGAHQRAVGIEVVVGPLAVEAVQEVSARTDILERSLRPGELRPQGGADGAHAGDLQEAAAVELDTRVFMVRSAPGCDKE